MAVPIGALIWTALGVGAAVRTLWNPQRAVMRDAFAFRCAGAQACNTDLVLETFGEAEPVYAVTSGVVVAAQGPVVELASEVEPVVVRYQADISKGGMQLQVQPGQRVWAGQQLGLARRLAFSVVRAERVGGMVSWTALEPASWLATRGLRLSAKKRSVSAEGPNWCEGGRRLVVPEQVAKCGMKLPAPTGYMLLPVSVTLG